MDRKIAIAAARETRAANAPNTLMEPSVSEAGSQGDGDDKLWLRP